MERHNSMTKIAFTSDIHLEFGPMNLVNQDNADILLLLGDISTPHYWNKNHNGSVRKMKGQQIEFFNKVSEQFPRVFYIPGNHESYSGSYELTEIILKTELAHLKNITVNSHIFYEEEKFALILNTLWTDFDNGNPISFINANMGMNDFRLITKNDKTFKAEDAFNLHKKALADIERDANKINNKTLIIGTHHLPSHASISLGFRDSRLNRAYASSLEWLMEKYNPKYWLSGHSHVPVDMMIGNTRLLRKPRGYLHHENSLEKDAKYKYGLIEV